MLIGEVVEKTGFSKDTIRYYEKIGLIKVEKKQRRHNNYKEYSSEVIERLEIIKRAKHLGFSLSEIASLIHSWLSKSLTTSERISLFQSRIDLLQDQINKMEEVKTFLQNRIDQLEQDYK